MVHGHPCDSGERGLQRSTSRGMHYQVDRSPNCGVYAPDLPTHARQQQPHQGQHHYIPMNGGDCVRPNFPAASAESRSILRYIAELGPSGQHRFSSSQPGSGRDTLSGRRCLEAEMPQPPPLISTTEGPCLGSVVDGVSYEPMSGHFMNQVKAIHAELFPVAYGYGFYSSLLTDPERFTALAVERGEGAPPEGKILGVSTARISEEHDWMCCRTTRTGYLSTIGVTGKARRRNIGSRLLVLTLNGLRDDGCDSVHLHVLAMNHSAIEFYKRHGFRTAEFLESYYSIDGVLYDAYLLTYALRPAHPTLLDRILSWRYQPLGLTQADSKAAAE
eukprot:TRINITY_DN7784_c4_g1_i1.p1 TRINITY_DN7784_c4_g1~~TRINITY_DN7784_c4_g1_i1.p1  ORF type:complete len:331 (+),score=33.04 TRINITY_DN7784_c4_g1_i1:46-1038(+)